MKFVLDQVIWQQTISFRQPDQAAADPLASRLFTIEGISSLMFLGDFVTVTKVPHADWKAITARVKDVLANVA